MTIICLVRHGQTDWNKAGRLQGKTDIPLNEIGVTQAQKCGRYLIQFPWDVMISSPLTRARQTAELISEHVKLPIVIMDEFIERNFGDAEGLTLEERKERFPDRIYANEEPRDQFKERILTGIGRIHQEYNNKRVLVVAHGSVINHLFESITKGEMGFGKTRITNASINEIEYDYTHSCWKITALNQTKHL